MELFGEKQWARIHDFLLSIGSVNSIDELNSKLLAEIPALVRFQNSGIVIGIENLKPSIRKSVNFEKKWNDLFHEYYHSISTTPDFSKNIFSINYHDSKKHLKSEYYIDFIKPQKIMHSAGFMVYGHDRKPAYTLVLNRTKSERMFTDEELSVMNIIQPHITNYYKTLFSLEQFRNMPVLQSELEMYNRILSARESEVLYMLIQRLKPADIAGELDISVHTVRKHIQHVYEKFKVADKKQLFQKINQDYRRND